jgi:hypothetical protein
MLSDLAIGTLACGLAIPIIALCLATAARADSNFAAPNSTTGGSAVLPQTAKLVWKAYRPKHTDSTTTGDVSQTSDKAADAKAAKDDAVQAAHYEVDVFGDDPPPKPTVQLASGIQRVKDEPKLIAASDSSDPFAEDLPSVKKPDRIAQRPIEVDSTSPSLASPSNRQLPPNFETESSAVPEPAELNPASPMHIGAQRSSVKTFQVQAPAPTPMPSEPQLDLTPGADQSPTARPHMPEEDCHDEYERVKNYTLNKLSVDIHAPKDANPGGPNLPYECSLSSEPFNPRCWHQLTYTWKASVLCHKPLYFEEVAGERYGHSHGPWCLEYATSFVHFFGDLALLPYFIGVDTPQECIYDLGYYRAGNCAPYEFDAFPLSVRGALTGAVGYCGVVALFP